MFIWNIKKCAKYYTKCWKKYCMRSISKYTWEKDKNTDKPVYKGNMEHGSFPCMSSWSLYTV